MKVIDKILNEWSFRCHDGIVDMNDPKKVKILLEIIQPILIEDTDDDILNILTKIDNISTKEKILKYLSKINQKEDKVEDKIEDNLEKELQLKEFNEEMTEYISLLASKYNITEELEEYLKSNQLLSFNDLDKVGNLYNIIKTKTDFPDGFIKRIINYTPSEGNKALGIGEVALVLFFNARKLEVGDIKIDNKIIEIKGTEARFPNKSGKGRSGDISDLYDELNKKYPNITLKLKQSSLSNYIKLIADQNPEVLDFINDKLNMVYPKTDDIKITLSNNGEEVRSPMSFSKRNVGDEEYQNIINNLENYNNDDSSKKYIDELIAANLKYQAII
jgi:hypothetical protein